jgi:uncharacterized protein (TIGR03083 family)
MATRLTVDRHLEVIERSAAALIDRAEAAGLDASVPTCPAWTARKLVAHQAMVHRWAAGNVTGVEFTRNQTQIHDEEVDLAAYFRAGATELLDALRSAPDDLQAMVFLKDAPPPRRFWARRQAHETTIHAVDALAASLGRMPRAEECVAALPIDDEVAVDGIDELLCGFLPRGRPKLAVDEPFVLTVEPTDSDRAWTLRVETESMATEAGVAESSDATFTGTTAALYLGLWNRGDEVVQHGSADVLARWRKVQRVTWS